MKKKRIVIKVGDIFCVTIDDESKCYFQYIANDTSQLNSTVIRVFMTHYSLNEEPKIEDIVNDKVDFYAHTILRIGIEDNVWHKIGNIKDLSSIDFDEILFASAEYLIHREEEGELRSIKVNPIENWNVWKINQDRVFVGELSDTLLKKVEVGSSVISYRCILDRIKYGYYRNGGCGYDVAKRIPRPDINSFMMIETVNEFRYYHYKGENLIDDFRLIKGTVPKMMVSDYLKPIKFWDYNWGSGNFITKDEFFSIKTNYLNTNASLDRY